MTAETTREHPSLSLLVAALLAIWLALVFLLGARGAFVRPPDVPPLPIRLGAAVPVLFQARQAARSVAPASHRDSLLGRRAHA